MWVTLSRGSDGKWVVASVQLAVAQRAVPRRRKMPTRYTCPRCRHFHDPGAACQPGLEIKNVEANMKVNNLKADADEAISLAKYLLRRKQ